LLVEVVAIPAFKGGVIGRRHGVGRQRQNQISGRAVEAIHIKHPLCTGSDLLPLLRGHVFHRLLISGVLGARFDDGVRSSGARCLDELAWHRDGAQQLVAGARLQAEPHRPPVFACRKCAAVLTLARGGPVAPGHVLALSAGGNVAGWVGIGEAVVVGFLTQARVCAHPEALRFLLLRIVSELPDIVRTAIVLALGACTGAVLALTRPPVFSLAGAPIG